MNLLRNAKPLAYFLSVWTALQPVAAIADDTSIFVGSSAGASGNPNVLIVLDNTSNWARQSQKWPGGIQQGQSEANAIMNAIAGMGAGVNIGLMEFVTGGTANDDGGFIRYAIKPMTTENKAGLTGKLTTIYGNVTSPNEKRNSNTPYGDLMYDVYNYFAGSAVSSDGGNNTRGVNPPNPDPDVYGYSSAYTGFQSPLSAATSCARNYVIFIGNPNSSGPASDSSANTSAMAALGCSTTQLPLPNIASVPTSSTTTLGNTSACYSSAAAAQTAYGYGLNTVDNINQLYVGSATATDYQSQCSGYSQGCLISTAATTTNPMACPAGTQSYHVIQTTTTASSTGPTAQTPVVTSANSTTCYASLAAAQAGVAAGDHAGLTCPATTIVTAGNVTTTTTHSCTWAVGTTYSNSNCTASTTTTNPTSNCYATAPSSPTIGNPATTPAFSSCPANSSCSYATGSIASTCSSPAVQTGTTSYLASAPTPTSPATASSISTTPALNCSSGWTCTYSAAAASTASGGGSTAGTTTATNYFSAPSFSAIDNSTNGSAVTQTGTTLSCPAYNYCTYTTGTTTTAGGTGGGDTTGTTTGYYTSTPSFSTINNSAGSSSVALSGTSLTCPPYNTCTYTATGTTGAGGSTGTTSGTTTGYYSSAPSIASIDNTNGSSSVSVSGTNLSCPAHTSCSYTATAPAARSDTGSTAGTTTTFYSSAPSFSSYSNSTGSAATNSVGGISFTCPPYATCSYVTGAQGSRSDTGSSSATTTTYYASTPTFSSVNNSGSGSSSTNSFGGANLTCPAYATCSYSAAQGTRSDTGSTTGTTTTWYSSAPTFANCDNSSGSTAKTCSVGGTNFTCPAYATCSYTTGSVSATQGANPSSVTVYASSAPNCATINNSANGSAQAVATSCVADRSLSCPANTTCTYGYTTGSKVANVTSPTSFTTDCSSNAITSTSQTVINDGLSGTPGSSTYSFGTLTFGTNVTLTSFTCGAYQQCVYTPANTNGNSGGCSGTSKKFTINVTETGLTPYTITQTPSPSLQYQYNVTQNVTPTEYPYTVTQSVTANAWPYSVTQNVTATATPYTISQNQTAAYQYSVTQHAVGSTAGYNVTQTATPSKTYTITQTPVSQYTWNITQTATSTTSSYTVVQTDTPSVTTTITNTTTADLGQTNCMASPSADSDYSAQCSGAGVSCTYNTSPASTTNHCPSGTSQYLVTGTNTTYTNAATGTTYTDTGPRNADEWARCLYQTGIPVNGSPNQSVSTYTIDVYNAQPNATQTGLLLSMAKNGGGKYFNATNEAAITASLKQILAEIQSVNSTFASASLPINATNRAQDANEVFIGMFRPDPDAKPRWFGNVKRYQLITDSSGSVQLGDVNGNLAVNNNTGFITDCATSWWTTDSGSFWQDYLINPRPVGTCLTSTLSPYSDLPDGPRVEKGAVAEVIRKGNNPSSPTTNVNRTMYSASGTSLTAFSAAAAGLSATTANWVTGQDTEDENSNGNLTEARASLHGDVVHSRPLPVNYCTTSTCSNIVVYYGANDGTLRAVDAVTGVEKWAFVAPEFTSSQFERIRTQTPLVNYPNVDASLSPQPRSYFFDGSIGLYQTASNDKVWIFPTMRRGGRTVYALDVTNSASPSIKWKFGCPNLSDDTGCTSGSSAIGQTWSLPNVAFIKSYSTSTPVLVMGGGYDSCEDSNTASPSCGSTKGNAIYVLDANTGAIVNSFSTLRSVAGDIALIDTDSDGYPDYAYAADTGGNIYRVSFSAYDSSTGTYSALPSNQWTITRVAYTSGGGRKFLFSPALFSASGTIYVALGSGDREHPLQTDYPYTTPVTNRFYVYRDCLSTTTSATSSLAGGDNLDDISKMLNTTTTATEAASTQAALAAAQAAYASSPTQANQAALTAAQAAQSAAGSSLSSDSTCGEPQLLPGTCSITKGWFTDLNNGTGEQTVTSALIAAGMVTFSTNRPIPASSGSCQTALGEARGYWLNVLTGSGAVGVAGNCGGRKSNPFVGGGLPPSPVFGVVPINGKPTSVVIGAALRDGGASSPISPQKVSATALPARKRVYNYIKGTDN